MKSEATPMKAVIRLGSNVKEQACEFCGDEAAELSVCIAGDVADDDDTPGRRGGPLDLCETCVLHAELQARDPEAGWDHAARTPDWYEIDNS